jgi:hypothetical protein
MMCECHVHTSAVPEEDHHILPQEYGGPTVKENMARICSNAHGDVHYFIALLLKYGSREKVPWAISRTFGVRVKFLAEKGYAQIVAGMPKHQLADIRRREMTYVLEEAA